jgi:hypothetical protein
MFLYQLVNLVLETCFIFSKILKSKARHFCLEFLVSLDHLIDERYDFPIPDYFLEQKCSRECEFLSIWGYFTKSIVVSILDF